MKTCPKCETELKDAPGIGEYCPEHDTIIAMGCYTMGYHIADNFRGGEFRAEILEFILGLKNDH